MRVANNLKMKDFIKKEIAIILVVAVISAIIGFFYFVSNEKGYDYITCCLSVLIMIYGILTAFRLGVFVMYLAFDSE